jgi:uncharacterized protein YgiM (DUF1202 family)
MMSKSRNISKKVGVGEALNVLGKDELEWPLIKIGRQFRQWILLSGST